jgi:hypothetical protein
MCYCFHNNVRDCQLIHYRLFILVSLYEIWLEIWAIPHTTLAKTASNISSEFYARDSSVAGKTPSNVQSIFCARDLSSAALPLTLSSGVVQSLPAHHRPLPLSLLTSLSSPFVWRKRSEAMTVDDEKS